MPKEFGRNRRVAQFIKEELSVLIQREFPLQQYGMITLTNVDVSRDLSNATIFITALNNDSSDSVPDKSPLPAHPQGASRSMQASDSVPDKSPLPASLQASDSVPDKSPLPASLQANEKLVAELNERAGHFRHEISRIMTLRSVPSICFKYDVSIERAQRLTDIIDSVSHSDNKTSNE